MYWKLSTQRASAPDPHGPAVQFERDVVRGLKLRLPRRDEALSAVEEGRCASASAEARLASTSGAYAKMSGAVVIAPSSNARPQRLQSKKPARQQDQLSRAVVIVPMVIIMTIAYDQAGRNGTSSGTSTGRS